MVWSLRISYIARITASASASNLAHDCNKPAAWATFLSKHFSYSNWSAPWPFIWWNQSAWSKWLQRFSFNFFSKQSRSTNDLNVLRNWDDAVSNEYEDKMFAAFIIMDSYISSYIICSSSPPEVFLRKDVLKICSKFTGEPPSRSAISISLFVYLIHYFKSVIYT